MTTAERKVTTNPPLNEPAAPVTEAAQTTVETDRKYDLFSKFWFEEALGRPIPADNTLVTSKNNVEKRDYLNSTLYGRVKELADELGVPKINSNNIAEDRIDVLENYAAPFLTAESKYLSEPEKEETKRMLGEIKDIEGQISAGTLDAANKPDFDSAKQRLYLDLVRSYVNKLPFTVFSYLPSQSAKHKAAECSIATAIGAVMAKEAGIEAERVFVPGYELLAIHTKNGGYMAYDMINQGRKPLRLAAGNDFYGNKTFKPAMEDEADIKYRIIVRKDGDQFADVVLGNTRYYHKDPQWLDKRIGDSIASDEDREIFARLAKDYPENFFAEMEQEVYGLTQEYTTTKEWHEEAERLAAEISVKKEVSTTNTPTPKTVEKKEEDREPEVPAAVDPNVKKAEPESESEPEKNFLRKILDGIMSPVKRLAKWLRNIRII